MDTYRVYGIMKAPEKKKQVESVVRYGEPGSDATPEKKKKKESVVR